MAQYNFKDICVVPNASDFIDIVLSRTQRKTPTVVHKRYKINNIRQFYMRKVKFCSSVIKDRIVQLLTSFPRVDNIHPFYADLIHVLYDKDHYKLALGQLNVAKNIVESICKDYIKLLKYADSLFRCKKLKKAALGRMCTTLKKQNVSLRYLEEVRQHLSRLPSIDPNTRTLIMTGYPNVGKSSFINKVSRAEVDVQPYAFTTKSLFVGHFFHRYIRWQAIDTPGVLDHPLQSLDGCNNIEMQAITAIAHIQACILFFLDLSPNCEYSIEKQLHLFDFLQPIFSEKPILFVASKCDLRKLKELNPEELSMITEIQEKFKIPIIELSNLSEEGIMAVRSKACDMLLETRISAKLESKKSASMQSRINVALPVKRDHKVRKAEIPESVIRERSENKLLGETSLKKTEKAPISDDKKKSGFINRMHWNLKDDKWKFDAIPEIINGQNVADWIDPEIEKKLDQFEQEEKDIVDNMVDDDSEGLDEDQTELFDAIVKAKDKIVLRSRLANTQNKPTMPRTSKAKSIQKMSKTLSKLGLDTKKAVDRTKRMTKQIGRKESIRTHFKHMSDTRLAKLNPKNDTPSIKISKALSAKKAKHTIKRLGRTARTGPGDNRILDEKPKHLYSGKRKIGKTDRR